MTVLTFCILGLLLIIISIVTGVLLSGDDSVVGFTVSCFIAVIIMVVYYHATPTLTEMRVYNYKKILGSKPTCMETNYDGHDIDCLVDYKGWLKDSAWAEEQLLQVDSVRTNLLKEIDELHKKKDETDSSANRN
jgi:hypothetical protein